MTNGADRLSELITMADVAVRAASQLRIHSSGHEIRDREALQKARAFIEQAIAGGEFVAGSRTTGLSASLRPLSWTVDVHDSPQLQDPTCDKSKYREVVVFLSQISQTLANATEGREVLREYSQESSDFLHRLGLHLGSQADESLTAVSRPMW